MSGRNHARAAAWRRVASAFVLVLVTAGTAGAQSTAASSAYGAAVAASLAPPLGGGVPIALDPLPTASGTAPPSYADGPNVAASTVVSSGSTGQVLSTGLMSATAASEVPGGTATTASATVDGLDVDLVGALPVRVLTLNATSVTSSATIDGVCGALTASGEVAFENAQLGGLLGTGLALPSDPQPNLVLVDLLGVRVIVNEQATSGDGLTSLGLVVNALRIELGVSLAGIGVLSGEIVLGHAEAQVVCGGVAPTPTPTPGGGGPTATPDGPGATPTPGGGATPTPGPFPTTTSGGEPTPAATATVAPTPGTVPTPTPLPGPAGVDPHTDPLGLGAEGFAGMTLNPGGIGQLLYGTLYDVRPVAGLGGTDAQAVNIQIVNVNPPGAQNGGVLARVRFRESRTSREVDAFDVALSCAEVWAGVVFLDGGGDAALPAIRSRMPIVSAVASGTVTTAPLLDPARGGAAASFDVPAGLAPDDVRRGYVEVIAQEQLPCEPLEPGGNTFARLTGEAATPPNSLAGNVALVRASAGASYGYAMPAVARFVIAGAGSIWAPLASGLPDVSSCINWDAGAESPYTGLASCLDQLDLVLSKSKVHATYDVSPLTAGKTFLVVALPTKGEHCDGDGPSPPFRCAPDGERIGCRTFDREANELVPNPACNLPRELSILQIGGAPDARADEVLGTGGFTSGWMTFSLASDPLPGGSGVHEHRGLDSDRTSLLGVRASGFRGLPALPMVLQEYFNGNVGGTFGMLTPAASELELYGIDP